MKNIIAIGGLKASGKNCASEMIQFILNSPRWMHNYTCFKVFKKFFVNKWQRASFAGALKGTLAVLLNIPAELFEDRDFKESSYIFFPTITITKNPPKARTLSDKRFSRYLERYDLSFLKTSYITGRQALQCIGTQCFRELFGDDFWVNRTLKDADNLIISDLRFRNEYDAVIKNNGICIYIDRGIEPGNHKSEREVFDMYNEGKFSIVINNKGSLKDLFNQCKTIIKNIKQYGR